ncbi:hypothetical protein GA0116948_102123 [Chitinophaga costaii]|uniref:Uncharacterized protein n=1 Tax=Chitinophaga costaii TaxID=1335309 RepID=A0A1C4AGJ6_9BACT|nr:hypothetical protein GA0116948_102123 [Chitinophaga costaii]
MSNYLNGFFPKEDSLEKMIAQKASEKAKQIVSPVPR